MALSYHSSQKCCLGGAKLSEDTRPGEARQLGLCSYKKHIVAARLTTNSSDRECLTKNEDYGDAVGGKEKEAGRGKLLFLIGKKKKHPVFLFTFLICKNVMLMDGFCPLSFMLF